MKKYTFTEMKDTRSGFGDGLTELGKTNSNVVALCARDWYFHCLKRNSLFLRI